MRTPVFIGADQASAAGAQYGIGLLVRHEIQFNTGLILSAFPENHVNIDVVPLRFIAPRSPRGPDRVSRSAVFETRMNPIY
jgi:hypothetical protein